MQYLTVLAAATTLLAGILHLAMIGSFNKPANFPWEMLPFSDLLFIISGGAQVFWTIPMFLISNFISSLKDFQSNDRTCITE